MDKHKNICEKHTSNIIYSVANIIPEEMSLLYTEQLNTLSPWFILNPLDNKLLLRSHNFDELFDCDCDSHDLSLNELPITQKSYNELVHEVNYTAQSNLFASSFIVLEMQCNKTIPLWLSLQPITLKNSQVGILVYTQPVDAPEYMTNFFKASQKQATQNIPSVSDSGTRQYSLQLQKYNKLPVEPTESDVPYDCKNHNHKHSHKFDQVQQTILNLTLARFSQKEIGKKLNLSRTRVAQHITHICNKFGIVGGSKMIIKHFGATH